MNYYITPQGTIFNEDNVVIHPDDNNPLWLDYVNFLTNGGTLEYVSYELEETLDVPLEVALWKLRFVLSEMRLEDLVTSAIEQLPELHKKAATYIWNYGNSVDRYSSTISFIQGHLGLSEDQVNQIFIQANSITL